MNTTSQPVTETTVAELQSWLKVIADPKRLRVINLLMEGIQCNCEIGDRLDMPRNLISHHLSILREAGLVEVERDATDARWVYYSINPTAMAELTGLFNAFFNPARLQPRQLSCGPQTNLIDFIEAKIPLSAG
jgi:ArsR family transcriptional regulator